jgi:hypothetical protein
VEDILTTREIFRKFALKAIDSETEIYSQIPPAWRTESKNLLKSMVNLLAGILDENLLHDLFQNLIDAYYYHKISEEEVKKKMVKSLTQQLNKWAAQRKLYVKKASFAMRIKF